MKNKKLISMCLLSLLLAGCDNPVTSGSDNPIVKEELAPTLVDDSRLTQYDVLEETFNNKIVLENTGAADPFVMRYNGMYYLYMTTGGSAIRGYKSYDLYNWQMVNNRVNGEGFVYKYAQDDNPIDSQSTVPYAPEVFYFDGAFYLITSPSGNGHYVLKSDSPEGPFYNVSGNIGRGIDGHYFVDGATENIYMYGSGNQGIACYQIEDDMFTVSTDEYSFEKDSVYYDAKIGKWNEGPYMLQKDGNYYLTYCGTHYLSASYRVNYAYGKAGTDLLEPFGLYTQDTVLLSTTDTFRGLGHSSTVLGPDMDSYYIAYHNLEANNSRNLNYSRLSFNGSVMVANDVKEEGAIKASLPDYFTYDVTYLEEENDFILSSYESEKTFTVEFNVTGEGKMVFSYIDESNYSYIEFLDNDINIKKVSDGQESLIHKIDLIREYKSNVNHTFRLQYNNEKMSLFFDSMEKAYDVDAYFEAGKIGYLKNNTFTKIGYTAFSNVALGSSDNKAYNDRVSLANSFDYELSYLTDGSKFVKVENDFEEENVQVDTKNLLIANKGNRATYRTNLDEGLYSIEMTIPYTMAGKKVGVRIDDKEIKEVTIPSSTPTYSERGDTKVSLGTYSITKGQHHISIYNVGDEIEFNSISYNKVNENTMERSFNATSVVDDMFVKGTPEFVEEGYVVKNFSVNGLIDKNTYFNKTYSMSLSVSNIGFDGYVGLVFNANAYSLYPSADADGANYAYPYSGYLLSIDSNYITLSDVRFNDIVEIESYSYKYEANKLMTLSVKQDNNTYTVYLDNNEIFKVTANAFNLSGHVGVFSKNAEAVIKEISVK